MRPCRSPRDLVPHLLLGLLICGFLVLGGIEARRDAPTYDEPVYVAAGLAALDHNDLGVNDEHPPLAKILAAVPVLAAHPARADLTPARGTPTPVAEHAWAAGFTHAQLARGRLRAVTFASRLVPLAETALVAILIFALASELWTGAGWPGLLAALLWLASPLVLGFGHLDGVDVPFALVVVIYSWTLLRWLRRPARGRLVALAVAIGAVVLMDADGLALLGLALVMVSRPWPIDRSAIRRALVLVLGTWIVIWLPYLILNPSSVGLRLLPADYVNGVRFLIAHDSSAQPGFLLGSAWDGGRWWFWPVSLAAKLEPTTLVLLALAPLGWRRLERHQLRTMLVAVVTPALLLLLFCLTMRRDTSIRYLLPSLALAAVGAGGLANLGRGRGNRRWAGLALAGLAAASVAGAAASFPNSLAWVDPVFGPGYRVADNADLDWGQDFYALASWSDRHPRAPLAYFGSAGLTAALASTHPSLTRADPRTLRGWAAASATELVTSSSLAWLRAYCPVRVIDGTLLIYRFASPPGAGSGPVSPASPCTSRRFSDR